MAIEILLRGIDNIDPDAVQGHLWKAGDIVVIKQVPHPGWGNMEVFPDFWKITIDSIDIDDPNIPLWLADRGFFDGSGDWQMELRRDLRLDVTALPPPVRNDILADGIAIIAPNRLQGFRDAMVPR